jgi:hypothetical protein
MIFDGLIPDWLSFCKSRSDWFDGGCAPPNPAPLAAAGVRGEAC